MWRIVESPGREIASMSHGISSFMYSWLGGAIGGLEGWSAWPPNGTPTFVPALVLRGATRVERLRREAGQNDGTARTHAIAEPNGFNLSGVHRELGAFGMMRSCQPRLSSCINYLSLDLPHLCIYIPHCPYGDDKCDTNDTIFEDLVLGGRLLSWCNRERDPWNGRRTHRWWLAQEQLPNRR